MGHVHTSADFSERCDPLPGSTDRLLRDTGNKLIQETLVEAGAAPSEPARKLNLNGWSKETLKAPPK
jgi:hypothetical protein